EAEEEGARGGGGVGKEGGDGWGLLWFQNWRSHQRVADPRSSALYARCRRPSAWACFRGTDSGSVPSAVGGHPPPGVVLSGHAPSLRVVPLVREPESERPSLGQVAVLLADLGVSPREPAGAQVVDQGLHPDQHRDTGSWA